MTQPTPPPPEFDTLVQLIQVSIARHADRPLFGLLQGTGIHWITYRQFGEQIDRCRAGLYRLGVKPGDAVALLAGNRLEWAVSAYAALSLGAHYVPIPEATPIAACRHILEDSEAVLCFVANGASYARLVPLRAALPKLRAIVNWEGPASVPDSYIQLLTVGAQHQVPARLPAEHDLAALVYPSDRRAAKPRGVVLSHANLSATLSSLRYTATLTSSDRTLACLPWAHVFGGSVELPLVLSSGASTVICPSPKLLTQYLKPAQPSVLFAVPRMWNQIYKHAHKAFGTQPAFRGALTARAKLRRGDKPSRVERAQLAEAETGLFPKIRGTLGGQLRYACSGAGTLPPEVAEFIDALGIQVYEGYGLTETSGALTCPPAHAARPGSVGKALPNTRIEIAGPDEGEIIAYGPGVTRGYHKQPAAMHTRFTADGGLRTGDLGRIDAEGYLYLTGRVG
jgi:long-chain acyl-CoA synthetase